MSRVQPVNGKVCMRGGRLVPCGCCACGKAVKITIADVVTSNAIFSTPPGSYDYEYQVEGEFLNGDFTLVKRVFPAEYEWTWAENVLNQFTQCYFWAGRGDYSETKIVYFHEETLGSTSSCIRGIVCQLFKRADGRYQIRFRLNYLPYFGVDTQFPSTIFEAVFDWDGTSEITVANRQGLAFVIGDPTFTGGTATLSCIDADDPVIPGGMIDEDDECVQLPYDPPSGSGSGSGLPSGSGSGSGTPSGSGSGSGIPSGSGSGSGLPSGSGSGSGLPSGSGSGSGSGGGAPKYLEALTCGPTPTGSGLWYDYLGVSDGTVWKQPDGTCVYADLAYGDPQDEAGGGLVDKSSPQADCSTCLGCGTCANCKFGINATASASGSLFDGYGTLAWSASGAVRSPLDFLACQFSKSLGGVGEPGLGTITYTTPSGTTTYTVHSLSVGAGGNPVSIYHVYMFGLTDTNDPITIEYDVVQDVDCAGGIDTVEPTLDEEGNPYGPTGTQGVTIDGDGCEADA